MSSDTIIEFSHVSKGFFPKRPGLGHLLNVLIGRRNVPEDMFWALKDITFSVRPGECLGIIGKNGAGKSTLLQLLSGIYEPNFGSIQVKSRMVSLLELGSGFNMDYTGRENIFIYASVIGMTEQEINTKLNDIIDFADIGEFIDQPLKKYSSGMLVRLAFAINIHMDADILIIDEALAVGDIFFVQKCMRAIREHIKTKTVLFVSHDTNIVMELCTRALLLEQGSIVMDGSPKDVLDRYQQDLMGYKPASVAPDSRSETEMLDQPKVSGRTLPAGENSTDKTSKIMDECDFRQADRIYSQCGNAIYFKNNLFAAPPFSAPAEDILVFEEAFLSDANGRRIMGTNGGELVSINLRYRFLSDTENVFVGFAVRDYKGQYIFSDNTFYLNKECPSRFVCGGVYITSFVFRMPYLLQGTYLLVAAAASGTPNDFTILSWVNEAGFFDSRNRDNFQGLVGIPMLNITIQRES